jgi:hypothetical protein
MTEVPFLEGSCSNKSFWRSLAPKRSDGDLLDNRRGTKTMNGSNVFHSRVSLTSCLCLITKLERDMVDLGNGYMSYVVIF